MEKTVYTNVDGSTTTEYSIPQILAIWTKDGNPGRGIDSIQNKYCVTNSSTTPAKEGESGAPTWYNTPQTPGQGQYLWNYEVITWINPSGTTSTDVQMIGYAGTNGRTPEKGVDYFDGDDGYTVICEPASLVINQGAGNVYDISTTNPAYFKPKVTKGTGTTNLVTAVSVSANYCVKNNRVAIVNVGTWSSANGLPVTGVNATAITNKYTQGYLVLSITADGKTFSITIPIAVNYLSSYIDTIVDGKKTEIAEAVVTQITEDGTFVENNQEYQEVKTAAETSEQWISTVNTPASTVANYNTRISTAEGNISTVSKEVSNFYADFQGTVSASTISAYIFYAKAGSYYFSLDDVETVDGNGVVVTVKKSTGETVTSFSVEEGVSVKDRLITLPTDGNYYILVEDDLESGSASITNLSLRGSLVTQSQIKQTANEIDLSIRNDLRNTGINITDRNVKLQADRTTFSNTSGVAMISVEMYDGIPSIVFYDQDGKFGGGKMFVMNMYGILQIKNTGRAQSWRNTTIYGPFSDGSTVQASAVWAIGLSWGTIPSVNAYIYEAAFSIVNGQRVYQPQNAKQYDGTYRTGNAVDAASLPTSPAISNGWYFTTPRVEGDAKMCNILCISLGHELLSYEAYITYDSDAGEYWIEVIDGEETPIRHYYTFPDTPEEEEPIEE
jgi:hypothetical protein